MSCFIVPRYIRQCLDLPNPPNIPPRDVLGLAKVVLTARGLSNATSSILQLTITLAGMLLASL